MNETEFLNGYKINLIQEDNTADRNWLFFPGGPGLGSEYLADFASRLKIQGNKYLIDFPMDGNNTAGKLEVQYWKDNLIELSKTFSNPIFVSHSFAGMLCLCLPELEHHLHGLVLLNTTSQSTFFDQIQQSQAKYMLPDLVPSLQEYHSNPSQEGLKKYWEVYKHYCFTTDELSLGEEMMKLFAYDNESYNNAIQNFYQDYQYTWAPQSVQTLIITSEKDYACPNDVFINDTNFYRANIEHVTIQDAGHCPWLRHFDSVEHAILEFESNLNH